MENILLLKLDEETVRQQMSERLFNLKRLVQLDFDHSKKEEVREHNKWKHEIQLLEKKL